MQPNNKQQVSEATEQLIASFSRVFKTPDGAAIARYFMGQLVALSYHPVRANEIGVVAYQEGIRKVCREVLVLGKIIDLKELTRVANPNIEPAITDFRSGEPGSQS